MSKVFPMAPASIRAFSVIGIVLIPLILIFALIAYSAVNTRFEVSSEGLHIKGAIYGRFIPNDSIILGDAKVVDLDADSTLRPVRRTNGIGLPGLSEGWFRLANGEKALMFVTDRDSVVYIPTRNGYSVLLSTVTPDEFLESLAEEWNGV